MSKATLATHMLSKAGVAFRLHHYAYDRDADRVGLQAAEALGIQPHRILKTLMVQGDGKAFCIIIPSDREASMKKVASAFSCKSAEMMLPSDAERLTGYRIGGISPFGQRKLVPTAIDPEAFSEPTVFLNGGQRGLQLELDPHHAQGLLKALVVPLLA